MKIVASSSPPSRKRSERAIPQLRDAISDFCYNNPRENDPSLEERTIVEMTFLNDTAPKLAQHSVSSVDGVYSRTVWTWPGNGTPPETLCLFLDAEFYLERMQTVNVISRLVAESAIPPVACLFVSHVDGETRHHDYCCRDDYAEFIARDIVSWSYSQPQFESCQSIVLCGLSLSGLQVAHTIVKYPGVFSAALCQSGSFWWLEDNPQPWDQAKEKFWLSVGDEELKTNVDHGPGLFQRISQIEGVETAARKLTEIGAKVKFQTYPGGHDFAAWERELPEALIWFNE